jgi:hypothetical protein
MDTKNKLPFLDMGYLFSVKSEGRMFMYSEQKRTEYETGLFQSITQEFICRKMAETTVRIQDAPSDVKLKTFKK